MGRHVALGCLLIDTLRGEGVEMPRAEQWGHEAPFCRQSRRPCSAARATSRAASTHALLDGLDRVGWIQVSEIIRAKLGSFGEKAQLILSGILIYITLNAKMSCHCVRFCKLIRQLAPPGLRGALRLLVGHWREGDERLIGSSAASTAHVRMAAAMASGPNPDLHIRRGDWFGHFFGHLFEMS